MKKRFPAMYSELSSFSCWAVVVILAHGLVTSSSSIHRIHHACIVSSSFHITTICLHPRASTFDSSFHDMHFFPFLPLFMNARQHFLFFPPIHIPAARPTYHTHPPLFVLFSHFSFLHVHDRNHVHAPHRPPRICMPSRRRRILFQCSTTATLHVFPSHQPLCPP